MRRSGTACLLLVSVAAMSGCGSSGSAAETSTAETTSVDSSARREFIARGDAICAQGQAEAADLRRRSQEAQAQIGTRPDSEIIDLAEGIWVDQIDFIERFHGELGALDVPPGDEARVEEFLRSITDGLEVAQEIKSKLAAGEDPSQDLVEEYAHIVTRGNTLAQAYGFTVCGRTT